MMRFLRCFFGIVLAGCLFMPVAGKAAEQRFDLVYVWDNNLDAIRDYKEVLEGVVDETTARHLKVVGRGDEYGVIYKMNGTQRQAAREIIRQSHSLLAAGLGEANAIVDDGRYSILPNDSAKLTARKKKPHAIRQFNAMEVPAARVGLEKEIGELINDMYQRGQLDRNERSAWMVYDVENGRPLVNINGNQLFEAASMIKPFVAVAFFHQVEAGKLEYDAKARLMVERMIQHSSNTAANWVMRQVGGPAACLHILRHDYGGIFRKTNIVEYIPPGGKTYRNKVIPSDYARFLAALWDMKLPYSKELRRVMALPGADRIYQGTTIPEGTLVYNKTGSTARLCGDMGILVPPPKSGAPAYAIVGVIERRNNADDYSSWIRRRGNVIRQVSSLVYNEIRTTK